MHRDQWPHRLSGTWMKSSVAKILRTGTQAPSATADSSMNRSNVFESSSATWIKNLKPLILIPSDSRIPLLGTYQFAQENKSWTHPAAQPQECSWRRCWHREMTQMVSHGRPRKGQWMCTKILIFVGNQRNGKEKHRHLLRLSREGTGKNQEADLHQVWRGHRTMGKDTLPTGVKIYLKVTWHHVLTLKRNLGIWHVMWGHVHRKTHVRIFITWNSRKLEKTQTATEKTINSVTDSEWHTIQQGKLTYQGK